MNRATWVLTALLLLPALPVLAQIESSESGVVAPPKEKLFTLNLKDAPIRQALENLFNNAKVQYSIESEISGFVTVRAEDLPLDKALRLLLRTASTPITYVKEGNVYRIISGTPGSTFPVGAPIMITIDLRSAPLRSALEQIFRTARQQFVFDPEIDGLVTMKIDNQPLQQALNLMLKASGKPFTWRLEQGVYYIEPKTPRTRPAPDPQPAMPQGSQGVVIPVRNLPAADLLRQLTPVRPDGIDNILVQPGTNALIAFSADPEAVGIFRKRVQLLDVASNAVVLKAEIVRFDEKKVRTVLFSTQIEGRSGSASTVSDKASSAAGPASDIRINLTPTVLDGYVDVASSWELSLPLAGVSGGVVRLEKSISTTTRLQPGKLTLVGETKRNQNGIKDQIQLYLSIEAEAPGSAGNSGVTRVNL